MRPHLVDDLANVVGRAVGALTGKQVVEADVQQHDIRLLRIERRVDAGEKLIGALAENRFVVLIELPLRWIAGAWLYAGSRADKIYGIAAIFQAAIQIAAIAVVPAAGFGDRVAHRHDPGQRAILKMQPIDRAAWLGSFEDNIEIVNAIGRAVDVGVLRDKLAISARRLRLERAQQRTIGGIVD